MIRLCDILSRSEKWAHTQREQTDRQTAATKSVSGKNFKVLHFDPAPPPGACDVSEVWAFFNELKLTVQVWLLYHHL